MHNISFGSFAKTYLDSEDDGLSYSGISAAYQYNFDKNKALYLSYGYGKLKYVIVNGEYRDDDSLMGINEDMTQIQVAGLLSSNNYKGWQFFTGLGYFKETLASASYEADFSGFNLHLGLGYSWETFVLKYRLSLDNSSDYPDSTNSATGNFYLSWNL